MSTWGIRRWGRLTVFDGILLFGFLAMTARNAVDPDLWWHLRSGQLIVETGHVPHVDSFSFTRAGHAWVSHEWLSEVVFYELWKRSGPAALIVFSAIIWTAGFMILYWRCPGKRHWAAAAMALGALAAAPCWGVRPQMFTFMLASLLLWLIERGEHRPALLLWIPPLFLLWLNLHAGFALAPALLLAYAAGLLCETAVGSTSWLEAYPILLRASLLLVACLALVPVNPSGAQLYRYPFDTLRSHAMRSFIVEWFSPDFHQWLYRPLLVLWLLLLTALASSRVCIKGRVLAPLLLTAFAALDAVRHIPIFVLVVIPVLAGALPTTAKMSRKRFLPVLRRRSPVNAVILVLLASFTLVRWTTLARDQDVREAERFPRDAVAFLRATDQPSKLFVYYDWGGYAIWKLYPQYRVFIDGRADLYGDDLMRQSMQTTTELRTGWRDVLDHWGIDTVLIPPSCALAQALLLEPDWHTKVTDKAAILLVRAPLGGQNAQVLPPTPVGRATE
ncbi:MAG: hypothetical protein ABSD53_02050 [Terriglobales bacterium]|jgi:hypothetical protein